MKHSTNTKRPPVAVKQWIASENFSTHTRFYLMSKYQNRPKPSRRFLGEIHDGAFKKEIDGSKHIYRTSDSFGFDAELFDTVILPMCDEIRIYDKDSDTLYTASIGMVEASRPEYKHFKPHRAQRFVKRRYFEQKEDFMENRTNS